MVNRDVYVYERGIDQMVMYPPLTPIQIIYLSKILNNFFIIT